MVQASGGIDRYANNRKMIRQKFREASQLLKRVGVMNRWIASASLALPMISLSAAAATPGIPGFLNPQTRIFVPFHPSNIVLPPATFGGTIKVNFTIGVHSALPTGDHINCTAEADVYDTASGNIYTESASSTTADSTGTVTCTVSIPYSWVGVTTADTVSLSFALIDTSGARTSTGPVASFAVPASGTIKSFPVKAVF